MDFWKDGTELIQIPLRVRDGEEVDHIVALPQDYWDKLRTIHDEGWITVTEVIDVAWNAMKLDRAEGYEREFWQTMAFAIQVFHQRFEAERRGLLQDNIPNDLESLPGRS